MSEFAGKVALVTGAAGGIGSEISRRFAAAGAKVLVTDIDRENGEKVAREIGDMASFHYLDAASEDEWKAIIAKAASTFGGLDVVVNVAGYFKPHIKFIELSLEEWRKHFALNTDSAFLGSRYGMEAMAARGGGAIVNFSSGLADLLLPDAASYCASKAAVMATTKLAALAGGPHKVRVNAVMPGAVETDMMWRNLAPGQSREELRAFYAKQHPIGRIGTPADMADLVLFLCSEKSGFITGACIPIDGGQTAS